MKRSSFTLSFASYGVTLALCGAARIWLRLYHIDLETGFYTGGGLVVGVFNAVLGLGIALIAVHYLLRVPDRDYPVPKSCRISSALMCILGVSIILYSLEMLELLPLRSAGSMKMDAASAIICGALGIAGGIGLVVSGGAGLLLRRTVGGILPLISGVWMLVCLVCRFNSYPAPTTVSDNLLVVLFMVFGPVFLVGHARTLSGIARRDGRNYTIPAGLCVSLCGFLAVLPNWLWMAVHQTLELPAPLLGLFESVFIFILSVYALAFTRNTCAEIRTV